MKTIGFIDYFLDEWHANEYPAMIADYNKKFGKDYQLKYAWAEIDHPNGGLTTDLWCQKYGATRCDSIEELCEKSDFVIVLSPSNPEKHPAYAQKVFACKKDAYIDKTFASDYAAAKKMSDLAKENGVKFFTSSALRYADELTEYALSSNVIGVTGGGSNFEEYIIHQVEMVVKCLGVGAKNLTVTKHGDQERVEIFYNDDRYAHMTYAPYLPFTATVGKQDKLSEFLSINSPFFNNLIADIFRFFQTKTTSFSLDETMEVMKIRETAIKARRLYGESFDIN